MCFFSCHRIIPHDRIYVEQNESMRLLMFWGPADRISSPTETKMTKQLVVRICPSDRFCRVQNLPTSSVELIWPITELYFRQVLSTDFMNRFYQDVKVAVNTIVPRSPFFLFLYLKTQTVTHIRKNAVEYLRQWNGAICVIYNLCQRQKIRRHPWRKRRFAHETR